MGQVRTEVIKVRVTQDEKRIVEKIAEIERKAVAQIFREAVLRDAEERAAAKAKTHHRVVVHAADPALVREVARIGNNINQIARTLNTLKKQNALDRSTVIESIATMKTISDELRGLLNVD